MIIYHTEHYGHLTHILTVRLIKHREETATLVGCNISNKKKVIAGLLGSKLFDCVISYPYGLGFTETAEEGVIKVISDCLDKEFTKNNVNLADASKIYTMDDAHNTFAIYLNSKNIEYVNIESVKGWFHAFYRYDARYLEGVVTSAYCNLYWKTAPVTADEKCVKPVIVYPDSPVCNNDYVERFDFNSEFSNISTQDKNSILSCFDIPFEFLRKKDLSLLLANSAITVVWRISNYHTINSYSQVKEMTSNKLYNPKQINYLYSTMLDYFLVRKNPLCCKQHPYSDVNFDSFIGENAIVLDRNMPIEVLTLIPDMKINQTLALETTSIDKIHGIVENTVSLGVGFTSVYFFYDKLHFVFQYIADFANDSTIYYYGLEEDVINTLYGRVIKCPPRNNPVRITALSDFEGDAIYIINTSVYETAPLTEKRLLTEILRNAPTACTVIFINSIDEFCFCDLDNLELLDYIVPVIIKKVPIKENPLCDIGDGVVYFFSKNTEKQKEFRNLSFSKRLEYTGVELTVSPSEIARIELEKKRCVDIMVNQGDIRRAYLNALTAARNGTVDGAAKFYLDTGGGFSEREKSVLNINSEDYFLRWSYDVSDNLKAIRIDPVEGFCCTVCNLQIIADFDSLPYTVLNGIAIEDGLIIFDNTDPQILVEIPMGKYSKINISGTVIPQNKREFSFCAGKLLALSKQKDETLKEKDREIQVLSDELTHYKAHYHAAIEQRDGLTNELLNARAEKEAQLTAFYNCSSWRITRPFRVLRRTMKLCTFSSLRKGAEFIKDYGFRVSTCAIINKLHGRPAAYGILIPNFADTRSVEPPIEERTDIPYNCEYQANRD